MQVTRSYLTAGAALATATSLVAAAPVVTAPALPDVQLPAVQLTGAADSLEYLFGGVNTAAVGIQLDFSSGLLHAEVGIESFIASLLPGVPDITLPVDSVLNGVVNRLYNVFNTGLTTGENFFNGLLGVHEQGVTTGDITGAALTGSSAQVFNSGEIGGLEGMFGQGLKVIDNVIGLPSTAFLTSLESAMINFNASLVSGLLSFNDALTNGEVALEELIFGVDNAVNGGLNRVFDAFNMLLDAGEQSLLGLLGADFDPVEMTRSLLTSVDHVLSDGTIGGLEGLLGQAYMALADFVGILVP